MRQLVPGLLIQGKFELLREIGKGGMGAVWEAHDRSLGREVAIKFIVGTSSTDEPPGEDARRRFEREARLVAKLRSHHVVQIFEYGHDENVPYIVMELLLGDSLQNRLRGQRPLSLADTSKLLQQVARALEHAHAAGIVHRDLKPANIKYADVEGEEIVKILDFGIAKTEEKVPSDQTTATGQMLGTPHFMSPEQARSMKAIDSRSDLWSLGVILYRCVTGRLPFEGTTFADLVAKICIDPVTPPSSIAPMIPRELNAFFARALTRDPNLRFQTAKEMARAFDEAVGMVSRESAPAPPPKETFALPPVALHAPPATPPDHEGTTLREGRPRRSQLPGLPIAVLAVALVVGAAVFRASRDDPATDASVEAVGSATEEAPAPAPEPVASASASASAPAARPTSRPVSRPSSPAARPSAAPTAKPKWY